MALDFDEAMAQESVQESQDSNTANSQLIANLLSSSEDSSLVDLAKRIIETQQSSEDQNKKAQVLQKEIEEQFHNLRKMQQDLSKLLAFFQDHEEAIRTSMYATSKYVIEEEASKATAEIEKVSTVAENQIKKMEDQVSAATKKATTKSKGERIITIIQMVLLIIIILLLYI